MFVHLEHEDKNLLLLNILSCCENTAEYARAQNASALRVAGIYSVLYEAYALVAQMRSIPLGEWHGALCAYLVLMRDRTAGRCIELYRERKSWDLEYHEGRLEAIDVLLTYTQGVLNS